MMKPRLQFRLHPSVVRSWVAETLQPKQLGWPGPKLQPKHRQPKQRHTLCGVSAVSARQTQLRRVSALFRSVSAPGLGVSATDQRVSAQTGEVAPILSGLHQYWRGCTNTGRVAPILARLHQYGLGHTNTGMVTQILAWLHQHWHGCTNTG